MAQTVRYPLPQTASGAPTAPRIVKPAAVGVTTDLLPLGVASAATVGPAVAVAVGQGVAVGVGAEASGRTAAVVGVATGLSSGATPAVSLPLGSGAATPAEPAARVALSASGLAVATPAAPSSTVAQALTTAVATASGAALVAVVDVQLGLATAPGAQEALSALIPFYIYPSFLGSGWDTVTADPSNVGVIVANPASGPGASSNSDYVTAIAAAQAAGVRVVGYVDTNYTARLAVDVQADIDAWVSFYSPDGIFLDRTSSLLADSSYYWDLRAYVDSVLPPNHRTLVLNHGTSPDEAYASIGDILITFENDASAYPAASFPAWMDAYPRERFSHILYADPDWRASLTLARSRPVGFFFSTDDVLDNPWDTLPTEWPAQQATLGATIGAAGAAASLTAGAAVGTSVSPGVGVTVSQGVVVTDAVATAASNVPSASSSASIGIAATIGAVSATASVATGTAIAVGFTPAVFVSVTLLPGVATASGVAPSSSAVAPILTGLAALTGASPGATGALGLGAAFAAGAALSATASISTGLAG